MFGGIYLFQLYFRDITAHGIAVLIAEPGLVVRFVHHPWPGHLVRRSHIGVYGFAESGQLPGAGNHYVAPAAAVIVFFVEIFRAALRVGGPVEFPFAVKDHYVAAVIDVAGEVQGSVIRFLVNTYYVGILPVWRIGRYGYNGVRPALERLCGQGKSRCQ